MLVGRIRPVETRTVDVEGASLEALSAAVTAQLSAGWVVTDVPAAMPKGSQLLTSTATMARRDGVEQIEADDMAALEAKVPEGWQLLSVHEL
ncbi:MULTISPECIES: hypothetical protein [Microbacterium]|uniref:hypothetical protein n=1 Tax=Microbacterium TaxID=33882 RepID=UPI00070041D7|nr:MULTISPECIES: hypothetical protein [Microbacterium]KQP69569.1 hypothetical protein ASF40_17060 [Microbacterium sp. Leaf288]MDR7112895.1 urease gamma subunit [Microbacterium trichothecenolyticum]MDT0141489.1 hypothetical protein [Microbacterium sp. PRC9]